MSGGTKHIASRAAQIAKERRGCPSICQVADYRLWSERAAQFDYTVEELQKIGALFWSWVLASQPPLN
jgi:hypothetical protein